MRPWLVLFISKRDPTRRHRKRSSVCWTLNSLPSDDVHFQQGSRLMPLVVGRQRLPLARPRLPTWSSGIVQELFLAQRSSLIASRQTDRQTDLKATKHVACKGKKPHGSMHQRMPAFLSSYQGRPHGFFPSPHPFPSRPQVQTASKPELQGIPGHHQG